MCTVNLNDSLYNSLLYALHAVKFFVKHLTGILWINCLKIIALPLDIHHNRKRTLRMALLLWGNLVRTGYSQISSRPQTNIVWKCLSCTCQKVCNALKASDLHIIAKLFFIFIFSLFCWCIACKQTVNHKL